MLRIFNKIRYYLQKAMQPQPFPGRPLLSPSPGQCPMTWQLYGFAVHLEAIRIRTVRHRGLKRFIEDDDERGIRPDLVNRVRRILTALISVESIARLEGPPGWRIHQLTGDRAGTWSISVSGNWRITFDIDSSEILEDYH
jgi:toxin HigB-1